MHSHLLTNIKQLLNIRTEVHPLQPASQTDCSGCLVFPAWCDSHTHLVYAGSREAEFVDKIRGLSYAEVNARGGGILNTVEKINGISEAELFNISWERLESVARLGTGALEIKSGYGLSVEGELKMLRVIRQLKEKSPVTIKSTFLGAHTFPLAYRNDHDGYIRLIIDEMLPVIAREKCYRLLPTKNWQIILMFSVSRAFLIRKKQKPFCGRDCNMD